MKRTIKVFVGGEPSWVGTLHYDAVGSRERSAFAYAGTWLDTADRFALEPALPLVAGPQFHRKVRNGSVFHGAFAAYLRGRGTSLGGMRPKCTVVDDDGQLAVGKFPSVKDERPVTKGEVLAMQLARASGLQVADARLVDSDGVPVTLIRRFDRTGVGGRIPYVSAATLLGVDPAEPREHFYTEVVDAVRIHGAEAQSDIDELWRRIAYFVLITNVDDHLHNHGFLHAGHGKWRLAPAFDLNPFPDRLRELKTWISEDTGPEATIEALLSVLPYFRISRTRAKEILSRIERALCRWRETGLALGMTNQELDQFAEAFEHPEREAARKAAKRRG